MEANNHYFLLIVCNDEIYVAAKSIHKKMCTYRTKIKDLENMAFGC
jgi:hypothetical protein